MSVIKIDHLVVQYGSNVVLRDFSFDFPEGSCGLLGPNGAGKTTLIKTLLGFLTPTAGSGKVLGCDIATEGKKIRSLVGYMPEQEVHIPGMTGIGFVTYAGELSGMHPAEALRRAHEVLEYCSLGEARYRNVETYSTGMKQRIKLAQALVHGPQLLLLDEPTNGLDPRGRDEMLDLIVDISENKGVNCMVCSHLLPDVERVCDSVVVIMQGEVRRSGKIEELTRLEGLPIDVELKEPSQEFLNELFRRGVMLMHSQSNQYRIQASGKPHEVGKLLFECAGKANAQIRGFAPAQRTLEEAFLEAIR